jgi:hypothetical protein
MALAAMHVPEASRFFARASKNIHDQQVEVGRRIALSSPRDAIVLVGDAGAIPYVSGRHAVDALGLGGYMHMPFVRAAVHGEAATMELIERLPPSARPTLMALYPNWFPGLTGTFGRERDKVTITDNVICGGVTKGIYDADWSAMRGSDPGPDEPDLGVVLDELDVADVVSEQAHGYVSPAPQGGWPVFGVHETGVGTRRFDAGRVIPRGQEESFTVKEAVPAGGAMFVRADASTGAVTVSYSRGGATFDHAPLIRQPSAPLRWPLARTILHHALEPGDRATLHVDDGELHDHHIWLTTPPAPPP